MLPSLFLSLASLSFLCYHPPPFPLPFYSPRLNDSLPPPPNSWSRSLYHLATLRLDQEDISSSSVAKRSCKKPCKGFLLCGNSACTCVYMSSSIRLLCLNVFGCVTIVLARYGDEGCSWNTVVVHTTTHSMLAGKKEEILSVRV